MWSVKLLLAIQPSDHGKQSSTAVAESADLTFTENLQGDLNQNNAEKCHLKIQNFLNAILMKKIHF